MPRTDPIISSFAPAVEPRSRIIDIGAGKGYLAQHLSDRFGARVTMVDVASYNQSRLPLIVCDSRALAFGSDSFDMALLSFVLHHSRSPEAILGEALRVARKVVVIENNVRGSLRRAITRVVDSWPALRYGTPPCYMAQSRSEWLTFFRRFPVEVNAVGEFKLESSFFDCFTVVLKRK
ncbi:MAG: class I SAM-dependent methyltransferase [Chloroflexi bacterium]|nr:class I SAM-dependent methyltransferase [Chloroflexota bacterium]MCL5951316.1 class I SAM-dependent methyltransferase [Chloroflexota bacterium]